MAAKNENMLLLVIVGVVAFMLFGNQGGEPAAQDPTNQGGVDLCLLVDGQASFTGQRMFVAGTALTSSHVKVLKMNGGTVVKDLGYKSMDSGTVSLSPNANYKLYYGENSTTYYTAPETYVAPCQESTDDKVGVLCTIDTSPTITVWNENGAVNTDTSAEQEIAADEVVSVEVKIKATADECYGNPDCPGDNAICFEYNSTIIQSVKASSGSQAMPYIIGAASAAGEVTTCYKSAKIADTGSETLTVTITPASGQNPTDVDDITIKYDDCAFDINADSLAEIWGFEDEDNNNLGDTSVETTEIYLN